MSGNEAKLANAASIEMYGNVMRSKGLKARAEWAYEVARNIRLSVLNEITGEAKIKIAA